MPQQEPLPFSNEVGATTGAEVPAAHHAKEKRLAGSLRLQSRHELAGVPGRAAHVVRSRDDERRWVDTAGNDVVIRRVGPKDISVGGIVGVTIFAQARFAVRAEVIAEHVCDRDERAGGAPEVGALHQRDRDHEPAVRAAEHGDPRGVGDPTRGEVFRDGVEVVV